MSKTPEALFTDPHTNTLEFYIRVELRPKEHVAVATFVLALFYIL